MFEPTWQGKPIRIFKRTVMHELVELGMDLWDVVEILESGYDCALDRRKKGVYEKCIRKGKKTVKVVVESGEEILLEKRISIWVLRHVGMFSEVR